MKKTFLALATCLVVAFAQAQTADEVISKHIEAIGGKEKLSQLNSVYLENTTEVMGSEAPSKTTILNGKGFRSESEFGGQKIIQVITDKGGWAINPLMGSTSPTPLPEEQVKAVKDQLYIAGPLFNYAEKGGKVQLEGKEKVGQADAFKLKYTNKDNSETTFLIDPSTYYILQAVKTANAMGQTITVTTSFSDYRKTDFGVVMPYTTNIDMGQFAIKMNTNKIEVNKTIDPAIFEMTK